MIGDAIGSVFEGASPSQSFSQQVDRRVANPRSWGYTDDTEMTLGVAESLIECGGLNPEHMLWTLARNCDVARGYGRGTRRVFQALENGTDWRRARFACWPEGSKGNGAAARIAPIACVYAGHNDLVDAATRSAEITHAHPEAIEGAVLIALAIAYTLRESPTDVSTGRLFSFIRSRIRISHSFTERLVPAHQLAAADTPVEVAASVLGTGVVALESVPAAIFALLANHTSFEATITTAIKLGGDTDTIGSIAGALSGALHGAEVIPDGWLASLEAGHGERFFERTAESLCRLAQ